MPVFLHLNATVAAISTRHPADESIEPASLAMLVAWSLHRTAAADWFVSTDCPSHSHLVTSACISMPRRSPFPRLHTTLTFFRGQDNRSNSLTAKCLSFGYTRRSVPTWGVRSSLCHKLPAVKRCHINSLIFTNTRSCCHGSNGISIQFCGRN